MKKQILLAIILIILGFLLGTKTQKTEKQIDKYFFIQEGVYDNSNVFESNITDLRKKVLEYKNNKIYIYIGITKDNTLAEKIKEVYQNPNIQIEEVWIKNEELKINIEQFDILLKKAKTKEEIMKIEEVVLANYEEIMKKGE